MLWKTHSKSFLFYNWLLFWLSLVGLYFPPSCANSAEKVPRKVCLGTNFKLGKASFDSSVTEFLRNRYTGCTHIVGNLQLAYIQKSKLPEGENGIGFLEHIQEVTGYVLIFEVDVEKVVFPNLQLIRGHSLFRLNPVDKGYSLIVGYSDVLHLEMPALKEVQNGNVGVYTRDKLCFLDSINWKSILTGENADLHHFAIKNSHSRRYVHDKEKVKSEGCDNCDMSCSGSCWGIGPSNCQQFPEETQCSSMCSVGCTGPTERDCIACLHVYDEPSGECRESCTGDQYNFGGTCVTTCPLESLVDSEQKVCLPQCPLDKHDRDARCLDVVAPEKLCLGYSDMWPFVHAGNIDYFQNCTILDGSIFLDSYSLNGKWSFPHNFTHDSKHEKMEFSRFETFRSLTEITGSLTVWGLRSPQLKILDWFQNLEVIGERFNQADFIESLAVWQTSVEILNLKSLRKIWTGYVAIGQNENLCFANEVNWEKITVSKAASKKYGNRDKEKCKKDGYVCSASCSSDGCWGSKEDECVCVNYRLDGKCVKNCRLVYGYVSDGSKCVKSCPADKYDSAGVCWRCHKKCMNGCTGPLSTVGEFGCKPCLQAVILRSGETGCMGRSNECPMGYYFGYVTPQEEVGFNLTAGTPFCRRCHELCSECTGYGIHSEVCQECAHYRKGRECEEECPVEYYADQERQECVHCAEECRGCFGPSSSDCKSCRNFKIYPHGEKSDRSEDNVNVKFICMMQCPSDFPVVVVNEDGSEQYCSRSSKMSAMIIGVISGSGAFLLLLLIVIAVICVRRRRRSQRKLDGSLPEVQPLRESLHVTDVQPNLRKFRTINEEDLRRDEVLGSGAFGTVYKGIWMPEENVKIPVAIKALKGAVGAQESKDFIGEAFIMAGIEHPHLLKLLALCLGSEIMLVTQLMPLGCLRDYLRKNKAHIGSQAMLTWSTQIAKGMEYLEGRRLVHRDLAARNVLVATPACVRITDFGLAKLLDVNTDEYKAQMELLPIKWLAPECITQSVFTHKSDVWAFGVTIWEILSCGGKPFVGVPAEKVIEVVMKGERLEQPSTCTLDLYLTLIKTWMSLPDARPSFTDLVNEFSIMAKDPGRYIVIEGDELMRLPVYTAEDERELVRNLASKMDHPDELLDAQEYFRLRSSYPASHRNTIDGTPVPLDSYGYLMPALGKD